MGSRCAGEAKRRPEGGSLSRPDRSHGIACHLMTMRFTTIAHRDHELMSPLASTRLDGLLDALELPAGADVVDIGCGNGAMLLRLLERVGNRVASAVGIDRNPAMIDRGQARAAGLPEALRHRVQWRCVDGRQVLEDGARWHALLCVGATGAFGGLDGALAALPRLLRPEGRALLGEGFWRGPPSPEYLRVLGASPEEMTSLDQTLHRVRRAGFGVRKVVESSVQEWDHYEALYASSMERWCDENPRDGDTAAFRVRIAAWRDAYRRWGRDTLGFATFVVESRRGEGAD